MLDIDVQLTYSGRNDFTSNVKRAKIDFSDEIKFNGGFLIIFLRPITIDVKHNTGVVDSVRIVVDKKYYQVMPLNQIYQLDTIDEIKLTNLEINGIKIDESDKNQITKEVL